MKNLQEIDLDKNLVIPIPDGFTKTQLAMISAGYGGYQDKITNIEPKEFVGTQETFLELMKEKEAGENYWITEIQQNENDILIKYQEKVEVENPISAYEYGIACAIKPIGNYIREAIINMKMKKDELQVKAQLDAKREQITSSLSILDEIKAL